MASSGASESRFARTKSAEPSAAGRGDVGGSMRDDLPFYISKANETLTRTAGQIFQCQRDMITGLAAGWRNGMAHNNHHSSYAEVADDIHNQVECMVTNVRRINDAARDCGWKLSSLYLRAADQASAQINSMIHKMPRL